MKLHLVKARTGATWVKLGMQTFFKQPLALAGLFFMFMALMSVASMLPMVGLPIAMALLPAITLGLMAATREAEQGRFPMPLTLLIAFRAGPKKSQAMLKLGAIYTLGFLCVIGVAYLVDGGDFVRMYLGGQPPTSAMLTSGSFQSAMWIFIGLHLPLSLLFWHAPALVYWQDLPLIKSMFFSIIACLRNFWAYAVFALMWMTVMLLTVLAITTLSTMLNNPELAGTLLFPALLLVASMVVTSLDVTSRDSFEVETENA
jgi:hypothetical protein